MARYKVVLAYDGTEFQGFQRQATVRTIQGSVEDALKSLGWRDKSIIGAGRTDAGVHASGQVISFDFDWNHSTQDLRNALNSNLPVDIAAKSVELVEADFHARYSAVARRYRYRLYCDRVRDPLLERSAWRVWPQVSMDALNQAAAYFVGTHNFTTFGTAHHSGGSTFRKVMASTWMRDGQELVYEILGNAFLYHMVRRLVNFQIEVGQGKKEHQAAHELLNNTLDNLVQGLAPAHGLSLVEVVYPPN
jgi:tRNA pseudouridine38-40 synthase